MGRFGKRALVSAVAAAAGTALIALPGAALASASGGREAAARVISYHGYRLQVPSSWPVFRLADHPARCVLFNRHAVYLGRPGTDQHCPARAFGRTEAVLVQPMGPPGSLPNGTVMERGRRARGWPAGPLAAANAAAHVMRIALPAAGVLVTATYGQDPALVRGILNGAQLTPAAAAGPPARPGAAQPGAARHGAARHRGTRRWASGSAAARHRASRQRVGGTTGHPAAALTGEPGSGLGFDTCTVPSAATMAKWLTSPFRVAATYIGGENWGCDYGNFTPSWISKVAAEGWRFIPIWVGPQAPCSTIPGVALIDPSRARAEGEAQAASAAGTAGRFGYGTGTPIYFDMEGYNNTEAGCRQAVLSFLDGWTRGLHTAGYVSGVYSSAASGIADLASKVGHRSYALPQDIWFADWNGRRVLTDPFVPSRDWADHQRLHQYRGPHTETWGGASVDIDRDIVDGEVAGPGSAATSAASFVLAQPGITAVYPGTAARTQLTIGSTAQTPAGGARVRWRMQAPAGLAVSPDHGTVSVLPGQQQTVTLTVTASSPAAPGRHNLPVTATVGGQRLATSYELVSVVRPHHAVPTAEPVVLYAADDASMALAVYVAHHLALPAADVTGRFSQAWADVTAGRDLLFAVGQAALNGLYTNPCGWSDPAGTGAGHTPFSLVDAPLRQPPGAGIFANATAASAAQAGQLAAELTHYALAGTLGTGGTPPPAPAVPTHACLGSPDVPVG